MKYNMDDLLVFVLNCSKDDINPDTAYDGLNRAMTSLPDIERDVLYFRYGQGWTLEKIGKAMPSPRSRERVRQIESKARRRLRHPSRSRKLREWCLRKEV